MEVDYFKIVQNISSLPADLSWTESIRKSVSEYTYYRLSDNCGQYSKWESVNVFKPMSLLSIISLVIVGTCLVTLIVVDSIIRISKIL